VEADATGETRWEWEVEMNRPTIREVDEMHDRIATLIAQVEVGSADYHRLYGAYRAIQWVLGFNAHLAGTKFEEMLKAIQIRLSCL
jgi:hypothetical protein